MDAQSERGMDGGMHRGMVHRGMDGCREGGSEGEGGTLRTWFLLGLCPCGPFPKSTHLLIISNLGPIFLSTLVC